METGYEMWMNGTSDWEIIYKKKQFIRNLYSTFDLFFMFGII
jgi:hypothetical protein